MMGIGDFRPVSTQHKLDLFMLSEILFWIGKSTQLFKFNTDQIKCTYAPLNWKPELTTI